MKRVEETREAGKLSSKMRRRNFSESCSVLRSIVPNLLPKVPLYLIRYFIEIIHLSNLKIYCHCVMLEPKKIIHLSYRLFTEVLMCKYIYLFIV